ncbi:hypothetical protein MMC25_002916 [Agyrium rufum]|nr:hypothetical protein [Agyrium rufum]
MASNGMNNLTTLIKRLEAATSRLEDIASSTVSDAAPLTNGVEAIPTAPGPSVPSAAAKAAAPPAAKPDPIPESVEAFDEIIKGDVTAFNKLSEKIGEPVAKQSACLLRSFDAERKFLLITTKAKKPDREAPVYMEILKDLQGAMGSVSEVKEENRSSPLVNHLATVQEGVAMLGWITVDPKPAAFVISMLEGSQFWGNKVLREFRDKDRLHVEWVQAFYRIFKTLEGYINEYHAKGVSWNNKDGVDPEEALRQVDSSTSTPAPAASGPPPPPPLPKFDDAGPPPPPPMPKNAPASGDNPSDMGAVFDQLSRGSSVTSGLRKVDPSQMTHKNPALRASTAIPPERSDSTSSLSPNGRGKSPVPSKRPKPESMRTKKPARKALDGSKWIIENFDSPSEGMITIEAAINHSILITKCTKTTIRVVGKANAISIDSSSGVSLVIDSLVSSVDVIKTPKFEMQVLGTLPTIMLDQVDGASLYLSKETAEVTEIFTSKCSSVNINVPGATEEDDYRECPLPEQIRSKVEGGNVISEIVEHAG